MASFEREHGRIDHGAGRRVWYALAAAAVLTVAGCSTAPEPLGSAEPNETETLNKPEATSLVWLEAEAASASGVLALVDDVEASSGRYLVSTEAVASAAAGDENASFEFDVGANGEYTLWVRWQAPAGAADAAYLGFNGKTVHAFPSEHGAYVWTKVGTDRLKRQGSNRVSLAVAEAGVQFDLFVVAAEDVTAAQLEDALLSGDRLASGDPVAPTVDEPVATDDTSTLDDPMGMQLRGDPGFARSDLTSTQQLWYDRTWAALENPSSDADDWAASGDLYQYGRYLNNHVNNILLAFRVTGDLGFLDEIDRISRYMEAQLADAWDDGSMDGYRNWRWYAGDHEEYAGKDTHKMDEALTHANVAAMAYALHANRDLASPAGVDYGARADFWYDYLKNDFEAKWRDRSGTPSGFPFMTPNSLAHTQSHWTRYHHYMGLLSGDGAYGVEAARLASNVDGNFERTSTSQGEALVWCHATANDCLGAQPTNYAGYTVNAIVDLTYEGVGPFTVESHLEQLGTTVSYYVVDNGIVDLAENVAGGGAWNGYPADDSRHLVKSLFALTILTSFEGSGELDRVTGDLYVESESNLEAPRRIEMPVARLLQASL